MRSAFKLIISVVTLSILTFALPNAMAAERMTTKVIKAIGRFARDVSREAAVQGIVGKTLEHLDKKRKGSVIFRLDATACSQNLKLNLFVDGKLVSTSKLQPGVDLELKDIEAGEHLFYAAGDAVTFEALTGLVKEDQPFRYTMTCNEQSRVADSASRSTLRTGNVVFRLDSDSCGSEMTLNFFVDDYSFSSRRLKPGEVFTVTNVQVGQHKIWAEGDGLVFPNMSQVINADESTEYALICPEEDEPNLMEALEEVASEGRKLLPIVMDEHNSQLVDIQAGPGVLMYFFRFGATLNVSKSQLLKHAGDAHKEMTRRACNNEFLKEMLEDVSLLALYRDADDKHLLSMAILKDHCKEKVR